MAAFVFLCDLTTEQECLDRQLFGTNPGEAQRDHYSQISEGDLLFLYNLDVGSLRGPFAALTPCTRNIEPTAWKKSKRSFPWQVRVDGSKAHRLPISADDFSRFVPLAATQVGLLPPPEITDEQASVLLAELNRKNAQ